jgi:hypothetical protein
MWSQWPLSQIYIHYASPHVIWNDIFKTLMTLEWDEIAIWILYL